MKLIEVDIELNIETIASLALEAHRQNITLNDLCNNILQQHINNKEEKE